MLIIFMADKCLDSLVNIISSLKDNMKHIVLKLKTLSQFFFQVLRLKFRIKMVLVKKSVSDIKKSTIESFLFLSFFFLIIETSFLMVFKPQLYHLNYNKLSDFLKRSDYKLTFHSN